MSPLHRSQLKFYLKILQYYSKQGTPSQGFVLPIMVGLGLIMMIVGLTMVARSGDSQTAATLQKQNAQALAIAETGITRTLSALNDPANQQYITLNLSDWDSAGSSSSVDPCNFLGLNPTEASELEKGEVNAQGNYTITDYTYDSTTEQAKLTVQGEIGSAQASLQVVIPKETGGIPLDFNDFPALYADNRIDLGNNDVLDADQVNPPNPSNANVICADCELPDGADPKSYCYDDSGNLTFDLTDEDAQAALGAKKNAVIDGQVLLGKLDLAPVPTIADLDSKGIPYNTIGSAGGGTTTEGSEETGDSTKTETGEEENEHPSCKGNGRNKHCTSQELNLSDEGILVTSLSLENLIAAKPNTNKGSSVINGSMTLPDTSNHTPEVDDNGTPGDTSDDIEIYHYQVDSINLKGNKTLTINTNDNQAVYLYVSGDITLSGKVTIAHNKVDNSGNVIGDGDLDKFRIYGTASDGDPSTIDQDFGINGTGTSRNAFIYAPNAGVGINGGGSGDGWSGVIWAHSWGIKKDGSNFSNSNVARLNVPDNANTALKSIADDLLPSNLIEVDGISHATIYRSQPESDK